MSKRSKSCSLSSAFLTNSQDAAFVVSQPSSMVRTYMSLNVLTLVKAFARRFGPPSSIRFLVDMELVDSVLVSSSFTYFVEAASRDLSVSGCVFTHICAPAGVSRSIVLVNDTSFRNVTLALNWTGP